VNGDGALVEIKVFDPQAQAFHQPQSGAIHELGGQFPRILQMSEHGGHLAAGQDDGRAAVATGGGGGLLDGEIVDAKDLAGEEHDGIECLFARGG
jgi:hypothetical protein